MLRIIAGSLLLTLASCRGVTTSYRYPEDLRHPNYMKRSHAVRQFVREQDRGQIAEAFHLLNDAEGHIRALACGALREMVGGEQEFGYQPFLPEADRVRISAAWRAWWETSSEGDGGVPEGTPPPGPGCGRGRRGGRRWVRCSRRSA
ncbi:MAG: hypothetical protein HC813_01035 [Planctomycetes bacterium]|nr:hypothetical protein [Planctomycetota bacterium]